MEVMDILMALAMDTVIPSLMVLWTRPIAMEIIAIVMN